jgi:hypothetical protein
MDNHRSSFDSFCGICIISHTEHVVINDFDGCFDTDFDAEPIRRAINRAEHETIIALSINRTFTLLSRF